MQSNVQNTEANAIPATHKLCCFNIIWVDMQQTTITKSIKDKDTK